MARYVCSCSFNHPKLGIVYVSVRASAKRFIARWKMGDIHVTVPTGTDADTFEKFLGELCDKMPQLKPKSIYSVPMTMNFEEFSINIETMRGLSGKVKGIVRDKGLSICVPPDEDVSTPAVSRAISKSMCAYARHIAPSIIIPLARAVAAEVGRHPLGWEISNGHRTLGHCSARGIIALSYVLVFLPPHLRRFIICHELAHLSEMNHSPQFHDICNRYCDGHEADLIAAMRAFKWPFIK